MTASEDIGIHTEAQPRGPARWLFFAALAGLAWWGTAAYLLRFTLPSALPPWVCLTFAAVGAGLLLRAYLIDRPTRDVAPAPLDLIWLAPLALLPVLPPGPPGSFVVPGLVIFSAGSLHAWRTSLRRTEPGGLLWPTGTMRGIDPWKGLLLLIAIWASLSQLVTAFHSVAEGMDNDANYYLGVARYMAMHHAFKEPIVWHFLAPPADLVHPPGDYWGPMTATLLSLPMMLFGANGTVAMLTVSAVAGLTNVLFWYVVCFALPLRHRITQLVAVLLFVFSERVAPIRIQTESGVFFHLFILLALLFVCQRRGVLALVAAFCAMLTRGDGIVSLAIVGAVMAMQSLQEGPIGERRLRRLFAAGLCVAAVYLTWTYASFGKPFPPATEMTPRLGDYFDVYDWQPEHRRPLVGFEHRFTWHYLVERWGLFLDGFHRYPFFKADDLWLGLGALAGLLCLRPKRHWREVLVFLLALPGYYAVVWASGAAYHNWRTAMEVLPMFVLVGAIGFDLVLSTLRRLLWPSKRVLFLGTLTVATALVAWIAVLALAGLRPYEAHTTGQPSNGEDLALSQFLDGAAVATDYPWRIIAFTNSPAVSVPTDGAQAIEEVLKKYHVHYLVLFDKPGPFWWRQSREVASALFRDLPPGLGSLKVERVAFGGSPAVFRVYGTD